MNRSEIDQTWNSIETQGKNDKWSLGGAGVNTIKALSYLNHTCAIMGRVGSDKIGKEIKSRFKQMKITTFFTKGEQETGMVNCFITPNERTMQTYLGAVGECTKEDIVAQNFKSAEWVFIEGYWSGVDKALKRCLSLAKENKSKVALGLASSYFVKKYKTEFEEILPKVDILFGNQEEIKTLTGIENVKEALESLKENQRGFVTLKDRGCWVKWPEKDPECYPTTPVIPKDPTGAGDFFAAGALSGILQGMNAKQCAERGNVTASFVIQRQGTDLSEEEVKALKNRIAKMDKIF